MKKKAGIFIVLVIAYSYSMLTQTVELDVNNYDMADEYSEQQEKKEEVPREHITQLQQSVVQLPDIIAQIHQKAISNWHLNELMSPWENIVHQVQQIAYLLQDELYAKIASEKQFDTFYSAIINFSSRLEELNEELKVPEFGLIANNVTTLLGLTPGASAAQISHTYNNVIQQKLNLIENLQAQDKKMAEIARLYSEISVLTQAYKAFIQQEKSRKIVHAIIKEISNLIDKNFFADFNKIEKLYRQAVAHIKKEQEEKEAGARAAQELGAGPSEDYLDYDWDYDYSGF